MSMEYAILSLLSMVYREKERKNRMPAIREQLEERWETAEGQRIAREVRRLLATGMPGATGPREVTAAELQQLVVSLPFNEEIAPRLDLRGLHLDQESIDLYQASDLSGAHLEYAYEIGAIMATRMVEPSLMLVAQPTPFSLLILPPLRLWRLRYKGSGFGTRFLWKPTFGKRNWRWPSSVTETVAGPRLWKRICALLIWFKRIYVAQTSLEPI